MLTKKTPSPFLPTALIILTFSLACRAEEIKVGVASQSPVKVEAVQKAIQILFPEKTLVLTSLPSESGVAEQPVGRSTGERGAMNRLESATRENPHASNQDYWVSIENSIAATDDPSTWEDQAVVVVQKKNHELVVEYSKKIPFPASYAMGAQKRTLPTYPLIGTGFSTTTGTLIQEDFASKGQVIAANDWQIEKTFGGISRKTLITQAVARAILKSEITSVQNFPKPGVSFKDITPLIANPDLYSAVIHFLAYKYQDLGIDAIAALEARGFLFGAPLAIQMKKPFIAVRKKGKLPQPTHGIKYDTEYSSDEIEISSTSLIEKTVLIVDDLLATGGTLRAAENLIKSAGAKQVYSVCLIELLGLKGRSNLSSSFQSILKY